MKRNLCKSLCAVACARAHFLQQPVGRKNDANRIELSFSKRNGKFPPRREMEGFMTLWQSGSRP